MPSSKILTAGMLLFVQVQGIISNEIDTIEQRYIENQLQSLGYMYHKQDPTYFPNGIHPKTYILPAGRSITIGLNQTLSLMRNIINSGIREIPFTSDNVDVFGEVAVQVDHFEEDRKDGTVIESDKDLMVWEKSWQLLYSAWNSNN